MHSAVDVVDSWFDDEFSALIANLLLQSSKYFITFSVAFTAHTLDASVYVENK